MKNHNDMRGRVGGLGKSGAYLSQNNYEIAFEFIHHRNHYFLRFLQISMQKQKFLTNFDKLQWGQKYFVIAFVFTISITGKIFFGFKADYLEECSISDILTQYLLMPALLWGTCKL